MSVDFITFLDDPLFGKLPTVLPRRFYRADLHGAYYQVGDTRKETTLEFANVVSSELVGFNGKPTGHHAPVLDLDVTHGYVPSTTPGHAHLYLDTPMTWRTYKKLLKAMGKAGILEPGYVRASIARKHTAVRLPWIKKGGVGNV